MKLYRSRTDVMIAGVCGGIAEAGKYDSSLVRLFALMALLTFGPFVALAYFGMYITMPESPKKKPRKK